MTYVSAATNLDPADSDAGLDVYQRDLQTGTTTLLSRATGTLGAKGDGTSTNPDISGDGQYVAFDSTSTNLVATDGDVLTDVFLRGVVSDLRG